LKSEFWEVGLGEILKTGGWPRLRRDPCCTGVYSGQQNRSCLWEKEFAIKMTYYWKMWRLAAHISTYLNVSHPPFCFQQQWNKRPLGEKTSSG